MYPKDKETQESIERQCALKAAVEIWKEQPVLNHTEILHTADKFLEWIKNKPKGLL